MPSLNIQCPIAIPLSDIITRANIESSSKNLQFSSDFVSTLFDTSSYLILNAFCAFYDIDAFLDSGSSHNFVN